MSKNTTIEQENTKRSAKKGEEDQESQQSQSNINDDVEQDISIAETPEGQPVVIINNIEQPSQPQRDYPRTISLYGDVSEKMGEETVNALYYLNENGYYQQESAEDPEETLILKKPIKMIVSTYGGSAAEMFSIHDTMRAVREETTIETVGHGKVMSAGVLLLASGTEGHRKIGRNCRVMIHSILGGSQGSLVNIENEIEEMRWIQERYIKCLATETKMTERKIQSLLKKQIDVYLSAEQAVEYGIADIII
tara:strand:+ start:3736 stop:4488 length:753 start_codon:yes stop_codon:yes gene_type:complete